MEETAKLIESLLERAIEYGKTSFDLARLKTLDKTTEVVSSFVPNAIVIVLIAFLLLFLSLGFAFYLGEILQNIYYGFFVVGAFYGVLVIIVHFFMRKWIKKNAGDFFIKKVLK